MLVPSSARLSKIHTNSKALSVLVFQRHLVGLNRVSCNRHISQLHFCALEEDWTKTYLVEP